MALYHHGKVALIPLAAVLALLFVGAAQAWTCKANEKDCNGRCVDQWKDVNNCGKCGHECPACGNGVSTCTNGKCGYTCKDGYKNCDNTWFNGCETDVSKDITNCGGCRHYCVDPPKAYAKCYHGKCEYVCKAGYANCDKDWKNGCECKPDTDVDNCGGCGKKCGWGAKCMYGKCKGGKHDDDDEGKKGGKGGKDGDDNEGKKGGKGGKHGDDDEGKKGGKGGKDGDDNEGKKGGKGGKHGDDDEGKKGGKGGKHEEDDGGKKGGKGGKHGDDDEGKKGGKGGKHGKDDGRKKGGD